MSEKARASKQKPVGTFYANEFLFVELKQVGVTQLGRLHREEATL
jgi:hypothetical protein